MYSLFYRFNILVFHRECFHLHRLTTSIFIYKQHFFLVWRGGGLNLRSMGIKCLWIEKCVLCAHIRVNLKEPPSKSMIFENAVVQSILHVVMISVWSRCLKKIICKIKKAKVLWIVPVFLFIQYIPTFVYWLFKCPKCTFDISCFIIWLCQFVLT